MKNLLFKELKLSLNVQSILFCCFSVLIIIPSWPSLIAFIYTMVGFFVIFPASIANRDIEYTANLPIRKTDVVKGKVYLGMTMQLFSILISIPFALLKKFVISPKMGAEMFYHELGVNLVLYGLVFAFFGLFNFVFIPLYYKNPFKTASSQIISIIIMTLVMVILMIPFFVPEISIFVNTWTGWALFTQVASLLVGIGSYCLFTFLAYKRGIKNFINIDI